MTNNNTTTTAGTTWVLYYTWDPINTVAHESALSTFTNQELCDALGVALPTGCLPDDLDLQETLFEEPTGDYTNSWDNCELAYLIHKVATMRGVEPHREFRTANELDWFLTGLYEADGDGFAHASFELNNSKVPQFVTDLTERLQELAAA